MSPTILIASSSAGRLSAWQQALQNFGCVTAASTLVAFDYCLKEAAPHLLLLDIELPELDRIEGVARLKN